MGAICVLYVEVRVCCVCAFLGLSFGSVCMYHACGRATRCIVDVTDHGTTSPKCTCFRLVAWGDFPSVPLNSKLTLQMFSLS